MPLTFRDKPKGAGGFQPPPVMTAPALPAYSMGTLPRYNTGTLPIPGWDDLPPYVPPVVDPAVAQQRAQPRGYQNAQGQRVEDGKVLMTDPLTGRQEWVYQDAQVGAAQPSWERMPAPPPVQTRGGVAGQMGGPSDRIGANGQPIAAFNPWTFNAEVEEQRRRNEISNATAVGHTSKLDPSGSGMLIIEGLPGKVHTPDAWTWQQPAAPLPGAPGSPQNPHQTMPTVTVQDSITDVAEGHGPTGLPVRGVMPGVAADGQQVHQTMPTVTVTTPDGQVSHQTQPTVTVSGPPGSAGNPHQTQPSVSVTPGPPQAPAAPARQNIFAIPNVSQPSSISENPENNRDWENGGMPRPDPLASYLGSDITAAPFDNPWEQPNAGATGLEGGLLERSAKQAIQNINSMTPEERIAYLNSPGGEQVLDMLDRAGYAWDEDGNIVSATRGADGPRGSLYNVPNPTPYSTEYKGGLLPLQRDPDLGTFGTETGLTDQLNKDFGEFNAIMPGSQADTDFKGGIKEAFADWVYNKAPEEFDSHFGGPYTGVPEKDLDNLYPGEQERTRTGRKGDVPHATYLENGYEVINVQTGQPYGPDEMIPAGAVVEVRKMTAAERLKVNAEMFGQNTGQYDPKWDAIAERINAMPDDQRVAWLETEAGQFEMDQLKEQGFTFFEDGSVERDEIAKEKNATAKRRFNESLTRDDATGRYSDGLGHYWDPVTKKWYHEDTGQEYLETEVEVSVGPPGPRATNGADDGAGLPPGYYRDGDGRVHDGQGHVLVDGQWYNETPTGAAGTTWAEAPPPTARSGGGGDVPISYGAGGGIGLTHTFTSGLAEAIGGDPAIVERFVGQWAPYEGPGPGSESRHNPLATTQTHARSIEPWNYNGGYPVQQYADEQAGIEATAQTLMNGYYPTILHYLRTGVVLDQAAMVRELRTWGTVNFASQVEGGNIRLNTGGFTTAPQFMVGDARGRNPNAGGAKPEIILNPTGAPIQVLNNQQTSQMLPRYALGSGLTQPDMSGIAGGKQDYSWMRPPQPTAEIQPVGPAIPGPAPAPTTNTLPAIPPVATPPAIPNMGSWQTGGAGSQMHGSWPGMGDWLTGGEGETGGGFFGGLRDRYPNIPFPSGGQWPWGGTPPAEEEEPVAPGGRKLAENTFGTFSTNPWNVGFQNLGRDQQMSFYTAMARSTGWTEEMEGPPYARGILSPQDIADLYGRYQLQGVGGFNNTTGY